MVGRTLAAFPESQPGQQPDKRDQANRQKEPAVAEPGNHRGANRADERLAEAESAQITGGDESALTVAKSTRHRAGTCRECHGLTDAERQPQSNQGGGSGRKPGEGGRDRPERVTGRIRPFHAEAIDDPSGRHLTERVQPEERGEQHPHHRCRQPEVSHHERRRDGQGAPMRVAHHHRRDEQCHQRPRLRCIRPGVCGWDGRLHGNRLGSARLSRIERKRQIIYAA